MFESLSERFENVFRKLRGHGKLSERNIDETLREIRRSLNLQEGDRVAFVQRGDEVVLKPLTNTLLDLRGSVPVSGPQDFADIREQVAHERAQKAAQRDA